MRLKRMHNNWTVIDVGWEQKKPCLGPMAVNKLRFLQDYFGTGPPHHTAFDASGRSYRRCEALIGTGEGLVLFYIVGSNPCR